jgi:ApaG protein
MSKTTDGSGAEMGEDGVRVMVESRYLPQESDPNAQRYVFAYTITIENNVSEASQLLNRHWIITDGQGEIEEVHGPGVVGQQPRIQPGQGFRYTSGAILKTPVGVMRGHYEFVTDAGEQFDVAIPQFSLAVSELVH